MLPALAAAGPPSAVVLEYHHVSDDAPASTRVTPAAFEAQMAYLADNGFRVRPLAELVARIRAREPVPDKTVALTFDDAYRSVHTEAFPRLRARGWPFTVFASTRHIDDGYGAYADWDALREMARDGATIANHGVGHSHLVRRRTGESRSAWRARVRREITGAQERLRAELDDPPRLFAYPYGEYSPAIQEIVGDLGFTGFGQQSGAFGPDSDFTALPRFPIATDSPSLERFADKVHSRPLPVRRVEPASGIVGPGRERPELRLTLEDGFAASAVTCYAGGRPAQVRRVGREPPVLAVRPERPIGPGRTKYNCTAPVAGANAWHWYSFLWMKPLQDGSWYRE